MGGLVGFVGRGNSGLCSVNCLKILDTNVTLLVSYCSSFMKERQIGKQSKHQYYCCMRGMYCKDSGSVV